MPRDQYQTVKEIADRIKVSEATVRGWIKGGELRAIDIGKGWRIADSDFNLFLSRHATCTRDMCDPLNAAADDTRPGHKHDA